MRESVPSQRETQVRSASAAAGRSNDVPAPPHSEVRVAESSAENLRASAAVFALLWARF